MDFEGRWCRGDGDVSVDIAICVGGLIFAEGNVGGGPFDLAGKMFEGRHGEWMSRPELVVRWNCSCPVGVQSRRPWVLKT